MANREKSGLSPSKDIVEYLRKGYRHYPIVQLGADEIEQLRKENDRFREALIFIGWASIQSVDDAAKYARNTLEGNDDGTVG